MFVPFLLIMLTAHVFADVELYTTTSDTAVMHKKWVVFQKSYHGGNVFIQLDTYSTSNAPSTTSNLRKNRFTWALYQLRGSGQASPMAKQVILEEQGVNKHTTVAQVESESPVLGSTTSYTLEDRIRGFLSLSLLMACAATWLIFFLHVMRLYKILQKRRQRALKCGLTKSTSAKASLTLPLLAHEGSTKQKTMIP